MINMRLCFVAGVLLAGSAQGAALFTVTVNTAAVNGQSGYINFQLNPGVSPYDVVSVDISNYSTVGGVLAGPPEPSTIGGVTGALPGTVTITNSGGLNDYFHAYTFGTSFTFLLSVYGPGVDSPSPTAVGGTTFGIGFYDATGTNPLLTVDPFGFAATLDIAPVTGAISYFSFDPSLMGGPPAVTFDPVPEPATMITLGSSLLVLGLLRKRRAFRR